MSQQNNGEGSSNNYSQRDEVMIEMAKTLERERDRDHYDPDQNKDIRRKLRQDYRRLINETEEHRTDYAETNDRRLEETLNEANLLFTSVKMPQEATLDSKLLVISADITTQRAKNLQVTNQFFSMEEFTAKLKSYIGPDRSRPNAEWNWRKLGRLAAKYAQRAPSMDFILGPLSVEKKVRKVTRQPRMTKNKEDLVVPTKLQEGDVQQQTNETSANVNNIYRILNEKGPTNYFEFITNPHSFSQSVENMFYVSFLIRNGVAEIDDSNGQPVLATKAHPTMEEMVSGLSKKQIIMSLDMSLWKEIIETYGIKETIIPTREKQAAMTQGKWY